MLVTYDENKRLLNYTLIYMTDEAIRKNKEHLKELKDLLPTPFYLGKYTDIWDRNLKNRRQTVSNRAMLLLQKLAENNSDEFPKLAGLVGDSVKLKQEVMPLEGNIEDEFYLARDMSKDYFSLVQFAHIFPWCELELQKSIPILFSEKAGFDYIIHTDEKSDQKSWDAINSAYQIGKDNTAVLKLAKKISGLNSTYPFNEIQAL